VISEVDQYGTFFTMLSIAIAIYAHSIDATPRSQSILEWPRSAGGATKLDRPLPG
jgi:hypothetical protein